MIGDEWRSTRRGKSPMMDLDLGHVA